MVYVLRCFPRAATAIAPTPRITPKRLVRNFAGVVKAVFTKVSAALEARIGRWPRVVAMNALGGCIYGALGYAMPLVLTDGERVSFCGCTIDARGPQGRDRHKPCLRSPRAGPTAHMPSHWYQHRPLHQRRRLFPSPLPPCAGSVQITPIAAEGAAIGSGVLAASCFAKMLAFHVVKECGFAGGLCLPMLTMSIMLGERVGVWQCAGQRGLQGTGMAVGQDLNGPFQPARALGVRSGTPRRTCSGCCQRRAVAVCDTGTLPQFRSPATDFLHCSAAPTCRPCAQPL